MIRATKAGYMQGKGEKGAGTEGERLSKGIRVCILRNTKTQNNPVTHFTVRVYPTRAYRRDAPHPRIRIPETMDKEVSDGLSESSSIL